MGIVVAKLAAGEGGNSAPVGEPKVAGVTVGVRHAALLSKGKPHDS